MSDDIYEVFAINYAHHPRKAAENYIGGDPHDVLQPLDYFVWAIVSPARTIIARHRLRRDRGASGAAAHCSSRCARG